jgi:AcrR family transcriptional regulator
MAGARTRSSGAVKRSRRRSPESQLAFKQALVDHAKTLYREQGIDAVSIRALTEAFAMSPMSFYGYFASKQDLIRHIWLDFFGELLQRLLGASRGQRSPQAVLEAHARIYIHYWETHPEHYRMAYLGERARDGLPINLDDDPVYQRLIGLTRERVLACALGRPIPEPTLRLTMDLIFVKALGYLHAVLVVDRYRIADRARLRRAVIADIVATAAGRAEPSADDTNRTHTVKRLAIVGAKAL